MTQTTGSQRMMEYALGVLRNEKISSSVLVLILIGAWWAYGWANEEFAKKSEVSEGFERIEINNASQDIRGIKIEVLLTEALGGSAREMGLLAEELAHATAYKHCLVKQEPNCEHVKEVE